MSTRAQTLHYKNLRQILGKYIRTVGKDSQDVWLKSDNDKKLIAGHQFILSACSPYFDSLFESEPSKMTVVMRGTSHKTLQKLVDFMYKGPDCLLQNDPDDPDWKNLYELGKELEVSGLLESIFDKRKAKEDENMNSIDILINDVPMEQEINTFQSNETENAGKKGKWMEQAAKIMDLIKNGTKQNPSTARALLNDILSNNIKYHPIKKRSLLGDTICTAELDGHFFEGVGDTSDEARENVAYTVLYEYLDLQFPILIE